MYRVSENVQPTTDRTAAPIWTWLLALTIVLCPGWNLVQYWLHNPLYGYGLWVPLLSLLLLSRVPEVSGPPAPEPAKAYRLLIICALALIAPIRWVQLANPDWRLLDAGLSVLAGLALLAIARLTGGPKLMRACLLPVLLLLTAVPWSTSLENSFTKQAVLFTSRVASDLLWLFDIPAADQGRTLFTTAGPFAVSDECSGIRSLQLAVMASVFWVGWFRPGAIRGLATLASSMLAAVGLNILRVCFLVVVAVRANSLAAADHVHDTAGSVAQALLVLIIPVLAWLFRRRSVPAQVSRWNWKNCHAISPKLALATVGWILLSETGIELWYRSHERNSGVRIDWKVTDPASLHAKEEPIPDPIRRHFSYSDGRSLKWKDANGAEWNLYWLEFGKGQLSACAHNIHRPDVCLPTADFELTFTHARLEFEAAGHTLNFAHQDFRRSTERIQLFHTIIDDSPATGKQAHTDWTFSGRLRAAALGLRSHKKEILHLSVQRDYPAEKAREMATEYLRQILVPLDRPAAP